METGSDRIVVERTALFRFDIKVEPWILGVEIDKGQSVDLARHLGHQAVRSRILEGAMGKKHQLLHQLSSNGN
ncbi:hypothetical protein AJ87_37530 [Rhizobium yanglingense]|nr:hypothetical protein AJ87_37530 [Rhizobium yanglingense]